MWKADPWSCAKYGIPPESYGDYAFVQHVIASMVPIGNSRIAVALPFQRLVVILCGLAMITALWYFLGRTATGCAVRAASQDRNAALLQGINLRRIRMTTMAIGAGMAALSGVLMASVINVSPYMGLEAIWKAFIVIVIVGGLGSIPGAIVAAMLFGLIDSIVTTLGFGQYVVIFDTVAMLGVLAFFPRGLLGREAPPLDQGQMQRDHSMDGRIPGGISLLLVLGFFAMLAVFPFGASAYYTSVGVLFLINLILVISYRTVTTMGGWSFAHITMLAIGGYTTALLQTGFGLSFWAILPLSGIVAAGAALIIAFPVMRTRQFYFFLSTFAAGEAIRQCFIQFRGTFGGIEGIPFLAPPDDLFGLSFYDPVNYYFLVLTICAISGGLLYVFDISRTGRTIRSMATSENLSAAVGINGLALKMLAFCTGSFFAGCAGIAVRRLQWLCRANRFHVAVHVQDHRGGDHRRQPHILGASHCFSEGWRCFACMI